MADSSRQYTFHPLERRGVLLGLDATQMLTLGAGALLALVLHAVVAGATGTLLAAAVLAASAAGALWQRAGRPLVAWVGLGGTWLAHRMVGAVVTDAPLQGHRRPVVGVAGGCGTPPRPSRGGRVTAPAGIQLLGDAGGPSEGDLGIIYDRAARRWGAAVPVDGRSFSLMDPGEQVHRLEAWRSLLGAVARPNSPVARLQWIERSSPRRADAHEQALARVDRAGGDPRAAESYRCLVSSGAPAGMAHHTWLVAAVDGGRRTPARDPVGVLRRELRLLEGQLRRADLDPLPPLGPPELRSLVASLYRLAPAGSRRSASRWVWPAACHEEWAAFRADDAWHATYWIAEWPRIGVPPDFLGPVLVGAGRRTVSVVMAPVPAERAMREVRSARTADVADAELRSRAGFLSSVRRERESEGVTRREGELADGHAEFRFSGYVSVSAADRDGLAAACADLEHAAQAARLELRLLYGRQGEAFTWTLPLGRGLR